MSTARRLSVGLRWLGVVVVVVDGDVVCPAARGVHTAKTTDGQRPLIRKATRIHKEV